ncbi:MAG TPA: cardiolipin synthase ClsB [Burkholderiales bacterium]|nr:cardiolipin synthase ClsB [Burkholderiales bacterium]
MTKIVYGNDIQLLQSGMEYFPALISAFDEAKTEIHVETYIFELDATGMLVRDALVRALHRGVKVHVLLDGYGSLPFLQQQLFEFTGKGIEVLVYRPDSGSFLFKRQRLRRLHRKIVLVDSSLAFVGGINIIDDMNRHQFSAPRFDFAVSVRGPLVRDIYRSVKGLWRLVSIFEFAGRRPFFIHPPTIPVVGSMKAGFAIRDNIKHRRAIELAYLDAVRASQHEIILSIAYFLPGQVFREALLDAARRGVRVILLLQGRADHPLVHYAEHSLYDELMSGGIEIHEYVRSHLHAKVAVIDEYWSTVGSSNLDPFSLLLAREANIIVEDERFARQLKGKLLEALKKDAIQLSLAVWRNNKLDRLWNRLAYRSLRVLIGLIGYPLDRDHSL